MDSPATPYVLVFKGYSPAYLYLYYKNNSHWLVDTIESQKIVWEGDLAIDRYNRIWCSYSLHCDTIDYFIVAHKDSTNWIKDTVGIRLLNQGASFYCSMIDIDSGGLPHITYIAWATFNPTLAAVYHTFLQDSIWQKEIVDSCNNSHPLGNALDVDAQNHIHISHFLNATFTVLIYAKKEVGGNWYYKTIDSTMTYPAWGSSLRINPVSGFSSIVYEHPDTYQLLYGYYNGSSWITDIVHPLADIQSPKALDFNSLGNPYLAYSTSDSAFVGYKDSLGWHKAPFPSLTPPLVRYWSDDLRIDPYGIIHMTARAVNNDYTYHELHYIYGSIEHGIEEQTPFARNFQIALSCSPNPFTRETKIYYQLDRIAKDNQGNHISIKIYDITAG